LPRRAALAGSPTSYRDMYAASAPYSLTASIPPQPRRRGPLAQLSHNSVNSVISVKSVTRLHLRDHLDHLPAGTGQTHDHLTPRHDHHDHLGPVQPCRRRHPPRYPAPLRTLSIVSYLSKVSPITMRLAILAIFRPVLGKRVAIFLPPWPSWPSSLRHWAHRPPPRQSGRAGPAASVARHPGRRPTPHARRAAGDRRAGRAGRAPLAAPPARPAAPLPRAEDSRLRTAGASATRRSGHRAGRLRRLRGILPPSQSNRRRRRR
jgi:hypothetical protein